MHDYDFYIWASYLIAAVVLCWMLFMALRELHSSEIRLKRLQNSLEPDREKEADTAG